MWSRIPRGEVLPRPVTSPLPVRFGELLYGVFQTEAGAKSNETPHHGTDKKGNEHQKVHGKEWSLPTEVVAQGDGLSVLRRKGNR